MLVLMELRHLRPKGKGTKQYRRRIPKPLQEIAGKEWWHRTVKATSHPALVNAHAQAEAAFERDVKLWERQQALSSNTAPTPAMLYALGQQRAAELLSGVVYGGDPEDIPGIIRDSIGSRYPKDPDTGHPLGVTPLDTATVQALGGMGPPERNLRDAKAHYIKERLGGGQSPDDRKMMERVERVFALLAEALGDRMDAPLSVLQLEDGRTFRDFLASRPKNGGKGAKVSPATVTRELGVVKAAVAMALREFRLERDAINPFAKLGTSTGGRGGTGFVTSERDKRLPLPVSLIVMVDGKRASPSVGVPELRLIWRLLAYTGCRLGEITGLRVDDVHLDGDVPYLDVRWHEVRRVKAASSVRYVPLVSGGLEAARCAVQLPRESPYLFPRYARGGGSSAASQLLNRSLRTLTTDPKLVVHSLRHGMTDWLEDAGATANLSNTIIGHALTGVEARVYGSRENRLKLCSDIMKKAVALSGLDDPETGLRAL